MADSILVGTGCSLIDYLFTGVDFNSREYRRYQSLTPGDGGLRPGELVFLEGLERFANRRYEEILSDITGDESVASSNLGGPSVVSLLQAAQLLEIDGLKVEYFGLRGDDAPGTQIEEILRRTPLDTTHYDVREGRTPVTYVLSDPAWDNGAGERSFINSTGVAGTYEVDELPPSFFDHTITAFGGTALVPRFHDQLHRPVRRAHEGGALTVVNTVYDFLNQSRAPEDPWPLGDREVTFRNTDLLILDAEEARRLSGITDLSRAIRRFTEAGVSAVVITQGPGDVLAAARDGRFRPMEGRSFPVSARITGELQGGAGRSGDTTGCGDNFVGGILYSLVEQTYAGEKRMDLYHAITWGVASGGLACFHLGGTHIVDHPEEKRLRTAEYVRDYTRQLGSSTGDA
jgi:sugar/nucleoside kinase (ribokinase family)